MPQPFLLKITDGTENADFISSDFIVMDGGFDIGTPEVNREYFKFNPDRGETVEEDYEHRDALITFEVHGTDRSNCLSKLDKISRIVLAANNRKLLGGEVELQYAWADNVNITYFDILSGDPVMQPGQMSIADMFVTVGADRVIGRFELRLKLSAHGYYISPVNGSMTEVQLSNTVQGTPATGGCPIQNPYDNQCNFIEVAAGQLPGGGRLLTKLVLTTDATLNHLWDFMYIGHRMSPFPTGSLLLEDTALDSHTGLSAQVNDALASGNSYRPYTQPTIGTPVLNYFQRVGWALDKNQAGTFMVFAHLFSKPSSLVWLNVGSYSFTIDKRKTTNKWRKQAGYGNLRIPLGTFQNPITHRNLNSLGEGDQEPVFLTLFDGFDTLSVSETYNIDALYLLPIDQGFRIWASRGAIGTAGAFRGKFVDDGFKNVNYLVRSDNSKVITNWITMLQPLRLFPNKIQRLYFNSASAESSSTNPENEGQRKFSARLYVTPTTLTLAY